MTDLEISQRTREVERTISDIINCFIKETGIKDFSPAIKFCMESTHNNGLRMEEVAHFYLHPTKTY